MKKKPAAKARKPRRKSAKKKAAKKRKPPEPTIQPDALDAVVLLLVSGLSDTQATAAAVESFTLSTKSAEHHVREARNRITLSASFDRAAELGTSYKRLNLLYQRSAATHDFKSALAAQKELNRLLQLQNYAAPSGAEDAGPVDDGASQAVSEHLTALLELDPDTPPDEVCRLAALRILGTP